MKEEINQDGCGRRDDLMAMVYGEATEQETRNFRTHLNSCAECASDLSAFQNVHSSLLEWRQQTVGNIAFAPQRAIEVERPSALAAIREFFRLSPVWLKGAVAFASVALCALVVLAVMRSGGENTPTNIATNTEAEIEKLVEARTQERLRALSNKNENVPTITVAKKEELPQTPKRKAVIKASQVATNRKSRPLTKAERDQLAADLRLTATEEEAELDLLGEGTNREQD